MLEAFKENSVCAVIVAYNPDVAFLNKIIVNLSVYFHGIILCNNSSFDIDIKNIVNLKCVNFKRNIGLARAQNIGYNIGIDFFSAKYIFNLDQDSKCSESFLLDYANSFKEIISGHDKIGVIGPLIIDDLKKIIDTSVVSNGVDIGNKIFEVPVVINSGSIINVEAYKTVKGFSENLFIDYVDFDICWRIRQAGFKTLVDRKVALYHSIGNNIVRLGFFQFPIHSPSRNFYQFRNYLFLVSKEYVPSKWKVINGLRLLFYLFYFLISFNKPLERYYYVFKGIMDYRTMKNTLG